MPLLHTFSLPLPSDGPPSGYDWGGHIVTSASSTAAFATGLHARDMVLGRPRCVVCGVTDMLHDCHIIAQAEPTMWNDLINHHWVPENAKMDPSHEARNGLHMCSLHHLAFDGHRFFIRYLPQIHKFILVNYSNIEDYQPFHLKALAIDSAHQYAPFPSVFIIHEVRVRAYHPFKKKEVELSEEIPWQDWITADMLDDTDQLKHDAPGPPPPPPPPPPGPSPPGPQLRRSAHIKARDQSQPIAGPSGTYTLGLNDDVIAEILAATHAMPSWKACQVEGMSWEGTAEENTQKYLAIIGAEDTDTDS